MQLLRSQLNELFELIEKQNYFSPSQFSASASTCDINFNGSDFYFRIFENTGYANSLIVNFSPGKANYRDGSSGTGWEGAKMYFIDWLSYLKREVSSPDKWGRLLDDIKYLIGEETVQNTHFSHEEYLEVRNHIETIKNALSTIPLLYEQNVALMLQLDHVSEMTSKLNKFDWRNFFIGTVTSCVIQLGVTQQNASLLADIIKRTFQGWLLLK